MSQESKGNGRKVVFISKATPEDDEFVLWLAPKLEAAGYIVFADILNLEPGDRWRNEVTATLQNKSVKMLLCCRDKTLRKHGVQEEIGIAEDLTKELDDPRFIIPIRLEPFKKLFGIGGLQYIDFVGSWARGLGNLLDALKNQGVPLANNKIIISPNWEIYKKRLSIHVEETPETLTSNWLKVREMPKQIRYFQPSGAVDHSLMTKVCRNSCCLAEVYLRGFFTFATHEEVNIELAQAGKFLVQSELNLQDLLEHGSDSPNIKPREIKNLVISILRRSWEQFCKEKELFEYAFSKQLGFHVTKKHVPIRKYVHWGEDGERHRFMLRNISKGKVWEYGVSALPAFWPFPHFKLKSRVLFSEIVEKEAGNVIAKADRQHQLRRSVCSGWRNKSWYGRLMAYLKVLTGEEECQIYLPLSKSVAITLDSIPMQVVSPVSTTLSDSMDFDAEEEDLSTLGNYYLDDED